MQHDTACYETKTESAILKTLEDLFVAIHHGTDIEVTIRPKRKESVVKRIAPLEVIVEDSLIYLIGAENMSLSEIVYYRVDQIDSFILLHTSFAKILQSQYYHEKQKNK